MGEMSQPAEEAISWSTDPVCALWFANRSARGTRLVSTRVDPEQILVYNPGYRAEHEVILKPGTKLTVQAEDMIPSTEAHVPKLLAPVTKDFFRFGAIATTLDYPEEHLFQYHGIKHAPILMTSVDTDPKVCGEERKAILRRLGVGNWKIFGAHGSPKDYAVK